VTFIPKRTENTVFLEEENCIPFLNKNKDEEIAALLLENDII